MRGFTLVLITLIVVIPYLYILSFILSGYYCPARMAKLVSLPDRLPDPNSSYLDSACRDTQSYGNTPADRGRTVLVPSGWAQGLPRPHAAQGVRYREVPLLHTGRWTRRNVMRKKKKKKRDAPPSICNLASEKSAGKRIWNGNSTNQRQACVYLKLSFKCVIN